jgi:hypothetical protein
MRKLLLVLLVGCTSQPPYDLEVQGVATANGDDLHVHLVNAGGVVLANDSVPFERPITYGDILDEGVGYQLSAFVDLDHDAKCSSNDHVWKLQIGPASDNVTIDLDSAAQTPTACF